MKHLFLCLALVVAPQWVLAPHLVMVQSSLAQTMMTQATPAAEPNAPPSPAPAAPAAEPAAPVADPLAVLRKLYFGTEAEQRFLAYSVRLTKLQDAAEAATRRVGAAVAGLDFQYHVNATTSEPGYEKTVLIAVRRNDGKQARVRVSLKNHRNVELVYDLVFENGRWVIDDVRSIREPRWILSRLYITGAREK